MIDLTRRRQLWSEGYWDTPGNLDTTTFDFTWRPDPHDRPYTHQFGTQHQKTGGPKFVIPENEGIKYQSCQTAIRKPDINSRAWRPLINDCTIDYSWHPDDTEPPFIYVFGNQWHSSIDMPSMQYRVKGATEKKYITSLQATLLPNLERWVTPDDIEEDMFDYSWQPSPHEPALVYQFGTQHQKTGGPTYMTPGASGIKYISFPVAIKKANMRNWRIPEAIEDGFDFTWHPDDTEPPFMYEFATQHQMNGGPIFVTRGATVVKYIDVQLAKRKPNMRNWRILESIDSELFDFSWHPDSAEEPYTYVFGNEYFPPEIMPTVMYRCRDSISTKYITTPTATLKIDTVAYDDSIFDSLQNHHFTTKYVCFTNSKTCIDYTKIIPNTTNTPFLHILNDSAALVPAEAKSKLYDKLSDYPDTMYHRLPTTTALLDVIFLSNGEAIADENYSHLLSLNLPNRVVRIDGINGRVQSQHAAANASNTPWYFLVNGKLRVDADFDFGWQPDRMKSSRHYVFNATNPVNGLEYGHMAIVANNKKLTLSTVVRGLDFTLDSPNEITGINSGVAMYNTSAWDTWRTAFRETIKLCHSTDKESKERLIAWLAKSDENYGKYSADGAADAVFFYNSEGGKLSALMQTYDWAWLRRYYDDKY